jgi:hypothetical protein
VFGPTAVARHPHGGSHLRNGTRFAVTVDDPERPAALVNGVSEAPHQVLASTFEQIRGLIVEIVADGIRQGERALDAATTPFTGGAFAARATSIAA